MKKHLPARFLIRSAFVIWLFSSCSDNRDKGMKTKVDPDLTFFDYRVRGSEEDSDVTVFIEFRQGGPNGDALELTAPAGVEMDGEMIPIDSAKLTGAYYEIRKPAATFVGTHTITFTDFNKKEHKAEFEYQPFQLKDSIPKKVMRDSLSIRFDGLANEDYIRISATDTSFASRDIVEMDTVKNNRLVLPGKKLKNLMDGPIVLLLQRETEKHIRINSKIWGRVVVSYGLQREFWLEEK